MKYTDLEGLSLSGVNERIRACVDCPLAVGRTMAVPGEGPESAALMFIGEGPGADEDQSGQPFVGKAGELLGKILQAAGFERSQVFITNTVKCRPPNNRDPSKEELDCCWPYLLRQIELVKPRLIGSLGRIAGGYLLSSDKFSITKEHGRIFSFSNDTLLMPLYHPSYLLRSDSREKGSPKHQMWDDMKKLRKLYDELTAGAKFTGESSQ
ncbi:MAG: uracil-DNA glycosylase [Candidatus Wallbacteria bacterium]|nr:uracil-DNA glycosylase [Candidatus Wallbacteria bacterium]